ncbi:MAG TPA: Arc family DNA-binding protein [Gemmatimonadaceae bacterium]|nr:Arc family DNA-binding protein [Gemmatimonadaceae bacterium]
MATLTVKNIPTELYERLRASAAEHRRSLNSEILVCLERALHSERLDPATQLARVDALRERAALSPVTDALLDEARRRMARTDEHPIPARAREPGGRDPHDADANAAGDAR